MHARKTAGEWSQVMVMKVRRAGGPAPGLAVACCSPSEMVPGEEKDGSDRHDHVSILSPGSINA